MVDSPLRGVLILVSMVISGLFIQIDRYSSSVTVAQTMRKQIDIQIVLRYSDVYLINTHPFCSESEVAERDTRFFVHYTTEFLQGIIRNGQFFQVLIILFEVQPVIVRCPVDLVRGAHAI